jgi:ABC-type Fe3+/spermidine/putrescine transport system ATPase subunit
MSMTLPASVAGRLARDAAPTGVAKGGTPATILEVVAATHRYGDVIALDGVSVSAAAGEFLTILGESGSGKTTLLRIISGLEVPTQIGALRIAGVDVSGTHASSRNCTTVFQHYALFPHMTVAENVGYGLKVRGVPAAERERRIREMLALVRLPDKYDRRIHQLSGGERQRIALARAIVTRPAILLLDEPLGALDEKLRLEMQVELLELHRQLGLTFVYITHSQEEALTMSDRVILMRKGRIVQEGPPRTLFDHPASRFVAEFMGVENILAGTLESLEDGRATVRVGGMVVRGVWGGGAAPSPRATVAVGIRAERVKFDRSAQPLPAVNSLAAAPAGAIYKGKYLDQTVTTPVGPIKGRIWDSTAEITAPGLIWWHEEDCMVMAA